MSPTIIALTPQNYAGLITLFGTISIVVSVLYLIKTSKIKSDSTQASKKVYRLRNQYLVVLLILIAISLFFTLQKLPFHQYQTDPDETVTVVAMQWTWKMNYGSSDQPPHDFDGSNQITLPAGRNIQFIVRSADVNHNFAIYNQTGTLIAQIQAMPGYENRLSHRFDKKGEYLILCLEYCGAPHTFMTGKLLVE